MSVPWLSPSEPRCRPSMRCPHPETCGRRLIALPASGAIMRDYSLTPNARGECDGYIALSSCVIGPASGQEQGRTAKPWPGQEFQ